MPPLVDDVFDAEDAIFLSSRYGLVPDEWQALVLRHWFARRLGKWAAPRCGLSVPRQNGKNGALEVRELFGMVQLGERFLHTAHEVKTSRKAFKRLKYFFGEARNDPDAQFPELNALVMEIRQTNGQEAIFLTNGGSIEFIARSKGSGRGFTVDVLVMDEAQELDDDAYSALLFTISAAPTGNPQRILTGTPPAPGMAGDVFTRFRSNALAGTDSRLCWDEWSFEPDADIALPETWAWANPGMPLRLQLQNVADEHADMEASRFARERGGVWGLLGETAGLDFTNWPALADVESEPGAIKMYGLAVSPGAGREWAAISVAGSRPDGMHHVDVGRHQLGTGWVERFCADVVAKHGPFDLVIDGGGPAASLIAPLEAVGVNVIAVGARELAKSFGVFMDGVTNSTIRHRDQAELNLAIRSAKTRSVGDGSTAFGRKASGEDITPLEAAALALLGHLDQQEHGFNIW